MEKDTLVGQNGGTETRNSGDLRLLAALLALVLLIWTSYLFLCKWVLDDSRQGVFGDMFGGLNTLFAGVGSAFLLFTIYTQGRNLRDQQKDIERQLKNAELQGSALMAQGKELARAAAANEGQVIIALAQIELAPLQAQIEAVKLQASHPDASRGSLILNADKIKGLAAQMAVIASEAASKVKAMSGEMTPKQHKEIAIEQEDSRRAGLKIKCAPEVAGCIVPSSTGGSAFKARIENDSHDPVNGCYGLVLAISQGGNVVWGGDEVKFCFAPSGDSDSVSKTLLPGAPGYLDIVFVVGDGKGGWLLRPGTKGHSWPGGEDQFRKLFERPGDYTFSLLIATPSLPSIDFRLLFHWTGQRDGTSLSLIES